MRRGVAWGFERIKATGQTNRHRSDARRSPRPTSAALQLGPRSRLWRRASGTAQGAGGANREGGEDDLFGRGELPGLEADPALTSAPLLSAVEPTSQPGGWLVFRRSSRQGWRSLPIPLAPIARNPRGRLQASMDVAHLLEVGADDFLRDAGPPVEIQGGKLLRGVLTAILQLQVDDLGLGREVNEDEPVRVGSLVDGEGARRRARMSGIRR